jgi:hypothetical protein
MLCQRTCQCLGAIGGSSVGFAGETQIAVRAKTQHLRHMVGVTGLEPGTSTMSRWRSNQLRRCAFRLVSLGCCSQHNASRQPRDRLTQRPQSDAETAEAERTEPTVLSLHASTNTCYGFSRQFRTQQPIYVPPRAWGVAHHLMVGTPTTQGQIASQLR